MFSSTWRHFVTENFPESSLAILKIVPWIIFFGPLFGIYPRMSLIIGIPNQHWTVSDSLPHHHHLLYRNCHNLLQGMTCHRFVWTVVKMVHVKSMTTLKYMHTTITNSLFFYPLLSFQRIFLFLSLHQYVLQNGKKWAGSVLFHDYLL